jgi:hypothetical protein
MIDGCFFACRSRGSLPFALVSNMRVPEHHYQLSFIVRVKGEMLLAAPEISVEVLKRRARGGRSYWLTSGSLDRRPHLSGQVFNDSKTEPGDKREFKRSWGQFFVCCNS